MLDKQHILERTNNGLDVFRFYLNSRVVIGKKFKNPLYDDKNASCNIYFDFKKGVYKIKDFGNNDYSGDCFFFVGKLNALDCKDKKEFIEIMRIINHDLSLGLVTDGIFILLKNLF